MDGMSTHESPLLEPTDEYTMRHAANLLAQYARSVKGLSADDEEVLNFAYQQLHRGANTLRTALGDDQGDA